MKTPSLTSPKIKLAYIGSNNSYFNQIKSNLKDWDLNKISKYDFKAHPIHFLDSDIYIIEKDKHYVDVFIIQKIIKKYNDSKHCVFVLGDDINTEFLTLCEKENINDVLDSNQNFSLICKQIKFIFENTSTIPVSPKKNKIKYIPTSKRAFDIMVSFTALLFASPVLLIIMVLMKIDSKGPIFYTSKRVGTGYKIFDLYKLRTMKVGADKEISKLNHLNQYANQKEDIPEECPNCTPEKPCSTLLYIDGKSICENHYTRIKSAKEASAFVKLKNDPRVTRLGNFLRKTSIDEIPQLINVLKGDMSVVGNRPLPLYEAEKLTTDEWTTRFLAPAGITGLWQVTKRGKSEMSDEERKQLDIEYAKNYSFMGDIKLIFKTIPALLQKENV